MAERVVHAPINTYFDVTPVGRILNRFSKDLTVADSQIGWDFSFMFQMMTSTLLTFSVAFYAVPWLLLLMPFVFLAVYVISFRNFAVFKEMNRIESVSKSPLLSYLQESFHGASTIRAFKRQATYLERNRQLLNNNILANLYSNGVSFWLDIRLDLLVLAVTAVICTFAVFWRRHSDPVLLSLLVNYTLQLNFYLSAVVRMLQMIEG